MNLKTFFNAQCVIRLIPTPISLAVVVVFSICQSQLKGATLLSWDFAGNTGSETTVTAGTIDPGLGTGSGVISRGTGLTASGNADRFNAVDWATGSIANAVSGNDYMQFSLNYNGTNSITVDTINFIWQRSATGTTELAIRSSLDSYANNLATFSVTDNTSSQSFATLDLGMAFENLASSLTFRIYGYSEATGGSGGFEGTGADLVVNGVINAAATLDALYWLGADIIRGGDGTWSSTGNTWSATDADGGPAVTSDKSKTAVFGGTNGGSVTLSGIVEADKGINFNTTGYSLSGGTALKLDGASAAINSINTIALVDATIQTSITGSTGISKTGAGRLNLLSSNSYSGVTDVSAGVLNIQNGSALGATGAGNETVVSSGAALELQGGISVAESLSLSGSGVSNGGALRNVSGDNVVSGPITLSAASTISSDSGSLTLDVASGNTITGSNVGVTFGSSGNIVVADAISLGSGSLTKTGAGTLTLQTSNSYTGSTAINGGILNFANGALGTGTTALTFGGGTLQYATGNTQNLLSTRGLTGAIRIDTNGNDVTFSGSNTLASGTLTKLGAGTLALDPTDTATSITSTIISGGTLSATGVNYFGASGSSIVINDATLQYNATYTGSTRNIISVTSASSKIDVTAGNTYQPGVISGAGTLNKTGLGTLNVGASNTFSGGLVVSAGTVRMTVNNAFENAGAIDVSGGVLDIATFNDTVGAVTLTSGSIVGTSGQLFADSFEVKSGEISARLNDSAGSVVLTKNTSGTVILTASNLYDGGTIINGGTLLVNNTTGSGTGTGAVDVNAGGNLGGTGTIGGKVTVADEGSYAAGNSGVGSQTLQGGLDFASGSMFDWELNASTSDTGVTNQGTYDQVALAGVLSGTSTFVISLLGNDFENAFWTTGKNWDNLFTGTFTGSLESIFTSFSGDGVASNGVVGSVGRFTFDGNTLGFASGDFSAVPEPTSALAGLLIAAGLMRRSRRTGGKVAIL